MYENSKSLLGNTVNSSAFSEQVYFFDYKSLKEILL